MSQDVHVHAEKVGATSIFRLDWSWATDFCAGFTAADAARAGFETLLVEDATRSIDADGSMARARSAMVEAGVSIARAAAV